jgi:hypothetical protein
LFNPAGSIIVFYLQKINTILRFFTDFFGSTKKFVGKVGSLIGGYEMILSSNSLALRVA